MVTKTDDEFSPIEYMAVRPLNLQHMVVRIVGTAPFMQERFSQKAQNVMQAKMSEGQQSRSKKVRAPRDFDADYAGAFYRGTNDRCGINASSFRNAMINACRMVGFKMTMAKMSIFVEADDYDRLNGTPLVWLEGTPERTEMPTRNATGVMDIRVRPMWRQWACNLRITWDADQFSQQDVINLLERAGQQVGVGEGRPFSKMSAGMGFGTFRPAREGDVSELPIVPAPAFE